MLLFSVYCVGQTSMHTEISRIDLPKDYVLEKGIAKEIIVTRKVNPGQDFSYSEKINYSFPNKSIVRLKRFKDSELESTREFSIDSLNRVLKNTVRFKHKSLGWRTSKYETVYKEKTKDLKILNLDGSLNYTMRVLLNEYGNPTEIRTLNSDNQLIGLSTAEYDYNKNTFVYTVIRQDGSIALKQNESFKKDYEIQRNEFGDLTEYYWPTSSNNVKYIVEYKYDDRGNWTRIKKIMIDGEKKKTTEIKTRKIKYIKN
ncbi:hypothetical protein HER15_02800 [Tenacibaculum mesophilum]|uniref:YD repeat-containing protein n=1 Tax=Tenacibaculum mesophilum TaxID=104268 RepID=A0AAE9MLV7_9FLAO|nr:hypothetical protein [Tenacibaculum mesophilum]UTD14464.1 hypothetical protein HER15_02800 [Tenacibaculum mesophilum]